MLLADCVPIPLVADMSPEAFDPEELGGIGSPADVWSMGCVMVEMLTGVAPWRAMQMQQIMMAVMIDKQHPDVPDGVPAADTLRRCFRFESTERPSASELGKALAPEESDVPEIVGDIAQQFASQVERLIQANEASSRQLDQLRKSKDQEIEQVRKAKDQEIDRVRKAKDQEIEEIKKAKDQAEGALKQIKKQNESQRRELDRLKNIISVMFNLL